MDERPDAARRVGRGGRVLRPRQDDHRDVVGHRVLPPVPRRGPADPARRDAHRVRAAALPGRRRRRGPDRAPARPAVPDGRRLGRRAGVRDRRGDAARVDRPDGLRRGRRAHRGAPRRGPGRRGRVGVGRRGGRADRGDPRRGPRDRDPDERGRRPVHRRHRLLRVRREQGVGHPRARRRARATTSPPATRYSDSITDAPMLGVGRPRVRGEPRPGAAPARRSSAAGARCRSSGRCRCSRVARASPRRACVVARRGGARASPGSSSGGAGAAPDAVPHARTHVPASGACDGWPARSSARLSSCRTGRTTESQLHDREGTHAQESPPMGRSTGLVPSRPTPVHA